MRPTRLELSGFASYREQTVVELDDAQLFVLTGPTGAGKSSLVDAIVFALYGAIPRYDDVRMTAPVITQGEREARVRLDFTIDDRSYRAVRVLRRTASGASTREARLERLTDEEPEVLATSGDAVTREVERLIGLRLLHFTTCVAIPQGSFAELLRARPKQRQDLLVELLDLWLYRDLARAANRSAAEATAVAESLESKLVNDLGQLEPTEIEAVGRRENDLRRLDDEIRTGLPDLEAATLTARSETGRADELTVRIDELVALRQPDDVDEIAENANRAASACVAADAEVESRAREAETVRTELEELPDPEQLLSVRDLWSRRASTAEACALSDEQVDALAAEDRDAEARLEVASSQLRLAAKRLTAAERNAAVLRIAEGLGAGEPCPVCDRPLDEPPTPSETGDLRALDEAATEKRAEVDRARDELTRCRERLAASKRATAESHRELRAIDAELVGAPPRAQIDERIAATALARDRAKQAERSLTEAATAATAARRAAERHVARLREAWLAFDEARDRISWTAPPRVDREDLASAWRSLADFARRSERETTRELDRAAGAVREAEETRDRTIERWRQRASALAVPSMAARGNPSDLERAVTRELGETERRRIDLERRAREAEVAKEEIDHQRARARIDQELGRLLGSQQFERWLLERALDRLTAGASALLHELSSGRYSLRVDAKGRAFDVIDHENADEPRTAKTLSGGETFLASLALALALADDVAQLAATGVARLETLILDEGFGTLDRATLDIVAEALERLGNRRMVGVITHLPELASRIPTRFEIHRDGRSSRVRRAD